LPVVLVEVVEQMKDYQCLGCWVPSLGTRCLDFRKHHPE
jgi:hypothetical protein